MALSINNMLSIEDPQNWAARLVESDPRGEKLLKVYKMICHTHFMKSSHPTARAIYARAMATQTLSKVVRAEFARYVPGQESFRLRGEQALLNIVEKRLRVHARDRLPLEVWGQIASFLPGMSRMKMVSTCNDFRKPSFVKVMLNDDDFVPELYQVRSIIERRLPLKSESFRHIRPFGFFFEALITKSKSLTLHRYHELPVGAEYLQDVALFLPRTERLCLEMSTLTEKHLEMLVHFRQLKELDLQRSLFDPAILSQLPVNITKLDLRSCHVADRHLERLAHLKELQELILSNNPLTGEGIGSLPPSLKVLQCDRAVARASRAVTKERNIEVRLTPIFLSLENCTIL